MKVLFAILATLSFSFSATAMSADYNHANLNFVSYDLDGSSEDLSGFSVAGEYVFHPKVLGKASYVTTSEGSIDYSILRFGARYMHPLENNFDLLVGADLAKASLDLGSTNSSDTEIGLNAHVRTKYNDQMQFEAGIELIDGNINFGGNMNYFFQENVSARGEIIFGDSNVYSIGASYWY